MIAMSEVLRKLRLRETRDYLLKKTFPLFQSLGFHVTINHFYSPVPDTRELKDDLWSSPSELIGIKLNEKKQLELLSNFTSNFKAEYKCFPRNKSSTPHEYYIRNNSFESVDGEVLYCMIRHFKPSKVFEVGSGFSTRLIAQAILKNKEEDNDYSCFLRVFDPYPSKVIKQGFPGLSKLEVKQVQCFPPTEFEKLGANDILFIDSSHVLKIGSDVHYEYLKVLPRLRKGVIVHLHDIKLPAEYDRDWILKGHIFWNEQYLLQAFLTFNNNYQILWAGKYMSIKHSDKLKKAFSSNDRGEQWPSSFWMKRIK
jgi:hypothetical protein